VGRTGRYLSRSCNQLSEATVSGWHKSPYLSPYLSQPL